MIHLNEKTIWNNGEPQDVLSKEEREKRKEEFKQAKRDKKKRKPGVVPVYHKAGKAGMDLENRFTNQWNKGTKKQIKKKSGTIKRLSLEEEEEEVVEQKGITLPDNFSTKVPDRPASIFATGFSDTASRQPNSGAMWHAKGDVTLEHALVEVKERGTVNSRGEKYISIPKEWLTKQEDEAFDEGRPFWYLAFAYKGDEDIFIIKPYDHEIELVVHIKELEEKMHKLEQELLEAKKENAK